MQLFLCDAATAIARASEHSMRHAPADEEAAVIALVAGFIVFYLFIICMAILVALAIQAAICYIFYICLKRLPPEFREQEPWQAFLLFIPCFNVVWQFFMFMGTSRSYQRYFEAHGKNNQGDCSYQLGMWACILQFIPVASAASPVLMIIYFVKMLDLRKQVPEEFAPVEEY